ncbi:host specificity protein J [Aquabacterium sp.]|uniref:host specificity protein J n=1 Tax=Aquabacterium sp. TaxID=1872578 RepID=UPI003D6D7CF2
MKSTYFNNTPVQNADGSLNFAFTQVDQRFGLPVQSVMAGYPSASNTINVGSKVSTSTPVPYTTSVNNIDAVRVTVRFPALFKQATNGDTNGTSVTFLIQTRVGSGAWSIYNYFTKSDKCIAPADVDYLIPRPTGSTGVWSVRVDRITADSSSTTLANDIYFQFATEIQNVQLPYNGYSYIGATISSETTGSTFPTVSFDLYGQKIKVPSNYTVSTRSYSGVWDGSFSATKQVCDNPAWVLYDLLTDPDGGMGLDPNDIDKFSFYDAAVYSDGLVPKVGGGTEPRFTFNYQFMEQMDPWTLIQNVAATFCAVVFSSGSLIRLVQDRPTSWSRLITNSNVVDGLFELTSSKRSERNSACIVYWNDPSQNWLSVPTYYEDPAGTARYGLHVKEITGLGITSEGQAQRLAKWHVDTSLNNLDACIFKVGFSNAGMEPGDVVKLMDTDWAGSMNEAKVVSSTYNSITLDREVTVATGYTIDVIGSDCVTLYTCTVTNTGNTKVLTNAGNSVQLLGASDGTPVWTTYDVTKVISFAGGAISVSPGADVIITGNIAPRQFKITSVKEDQPGTYTVSALQYDPNKFARVDSTPTGVTPAYQVQSAMAVVSPVVGIVFSEESYTDVDGTSKRNLVARWTPVSGQFVTAYKVFWSKDDNILTNQDVVQPNSRLRVDTDGIYKIEIYAYNARGARSPGASNTYTVELAAPSTGSSFVPVTSLAVKTAGGTTFTGTDCSVVWSDPNTNGAAVVDGYQVQILDASSPTTVYRTEFVKTRAYTYDLTKQQQDNGANLKRSFIVSVKVKDTWGRYSTATAVTFANPAPPVVSGLTATGGIKTNFLSWQALVDSDLKGYLVWRGTTSTFTPSSLNLVSDGFTTTLTDASVSDSTTYYYKVAGYDTFGKDLTGAGLNIVTSAAATTLNSAGSNEYKLTGVTWTPNSPSANQISWTACTAVKTLGASAGSTWAISAGSATWTSGILWIYYAEGNTALSTTTNQATAFAANQTVVATYRGGTNFEYGDGKAYMDGSYLIAGTVGASQLVTGSAIITGPAQMGSAVINEAAIGNLQVTTLKIGDNAVTIPVISTSDTELSGPYNGTGGTMLTPYIYVEISRNTITSKGGIIRLDATAELMADTYNSAYYTNSPMVFEGYVRCFLNGVEVGSAQAYGPPLMYQTATPWSFITFPWVTVQPGPGTHTFTMVMSYRRKTGATNAQGRYTARRRGIYTLEVLK